MITEADFRERYVPKAVEYIDNTSRSLVEKAQYKELYTEVESNTQYVMVKQKESMGPLQRTPTASQLPELRIRDGWDKRIYQFKYTGIARYPIEVRTFGATDVIADITKGLALARPHLMEIMGVTLFIYGQYALTSAPTVLGVPMVDTTSADGEPIFDTAHPYKSDPSVTIKNRSSAILELTQSNLQSVCNDILAWQLSSTAYMNVMAKRLIVPRQLRHKARELLGSKLQPETANNAVNALREDFGEGDYFVYRWLTSATEWYVETDAPNDFKFRKALESKAEKGYNGENQTHWISQTTIFSQGVADPTRFYKVCAA